MDVDHGPDIKDDFLANENTHTHTPGPPKSKGWLMDTPSTSKKTGGPESIPRVLMFSRETFRANLTPWGPPNARAP